ncbi:nudix hydrolase 8-like isoform X1 [Phragmites australis]|uniref:nudix hydrolase 8-like isoform X1 n=1 Tax=Phragmites australis TaxID=29695 RepID=UPI002D79F33C|nr:nudix hydrolase 8-like isoform X1 [Phragmites australis]XP_062218616.1 nudix hydrolase 8-like isoform X1 [Phragmites australis]
MSFIRQGKRGVWLKILEDQADLVPIAIKARFIYHHAEPGYVMLTFWLPDRPSALPSTALHQIGVGAFVMNDKRKFEHLFSGAIREVREETGIETSFLDVVAFRYIKKNSIKSCEPFRQAFLFEKYFVILLYSYRHAHRVPFEKSDILFLCTLKPLSFDISIDESEIEAAMWMPIDEFLSQPIHQEDEMCKKIIDIWIAKHQKCYEGFAAHQVMLKLDNRVAYLYFGDTSEVTGLVPETKPNEEETEGVFPTGERGPVEIFGRNSTN